MTDHDELRQLLRDLIAAAGKLGQLQEHASQLRGVGQGGKTK
jgi:hypothetical protein